jgi:hypothetical protein
LGTYRMEEISGTEWVEHQRFGQKPQNVAAAACYHEQKLWLIVIT